jgi:hypothetical protein
MLIWMRSLRHLGGSERAKFSPKVNGAWAAWVLHFTLQSGSIPKTASIHWLESLSMESCIHRNYTQPCGVSAQHLFDFANTVAKDSLTASFKLA